MKLVSISYDALCELIGASKSWSEELSDMSDQSMPTARHEINLEILDLSRAIQEAQKAISYI